MTLETTTYSAYRGFAWSSQPKGVSTRRLNQFYREISAARGDFPDSDEVEFGMVSDGKLAAAFTLQNAPRWDAEKRDSDYLALALFPVGQAAEIDFVELINNDFFWTPSRKPITQIEYEGPAAVKVPPTAQKQLQTHQQYLLKNPRALGAIIAKYGARSSRWISMMQAENIIKINCNRWS